MIKRSPRVSRERDEKLKNSHLGENTGFEPRFGDRRGIYLGAEAGNLISIEEDESFITLSRQWREPSVARPSAVANPNRQQLA